MDTNAPAVCLDVRLTKLQNTSRYSERGEIVTPAAVTPERIPADGFLQAALPGQKIECLGRKTTVPMQGSGRWVRPARPSSLFFQALHLAFDKHYPFALRPEVCLQIILHEVGIAVNKHPETYRSLFTRSAEKQKVEVRHDGLRRGDPESPWIEVFPAFNAQLRQLVPPGIMPHMVPGFSTSTLETEAAALIAFMDAAQQFYDYRTHTMCGIPHIRLLGTVEDWRQVRRSAAALAEAMAADLGTYFRHLLPVLDTLVRQAEGAPLDERFWSSIYKFESHSGTDRFNGWASAFVNYIQTTDSKYEDEPRTIKAKPVEAYDWKAPGEGYGMAGLEVGSLPSHVSTAPFTWNYFGTELPMTFAGGVPAVTDTDGYLTPELSWAVL